MKAEWTMAGKAGWLGLVGVAAISAAAALALPHTLTSEQINSAGHTFVLPLSSEVSNTLLPDGRTFEVHGAQGLAYLLDGATRRRVSLPEIRRFASVTVMPGGQVLLWGGIDAQGQVLDNGEWFEPTSEQFVRTGVLGLPARAGHTLTVLTNGEVLLTGGWSTEGAATTTSVLWQPQSHQITALTGVSGSPRLEAFAQLQADGSVRSAIVPTFRFRHPNVGCHNGGAARSRWQRRCGGYLACQRDHCSPDPGAADRAFCGASGRAAVERQHSDPARARRHRVSARGRCRRWPSGLCAPTE
jgi:hypothetical protein